MNGSVISTCVSRSFHLLPYCCRKQLPTGRRSPASPHHSPLFFQVSTEYNTGAMEKLQKKKIKRTHIQTYSSCLHLNFFLFSKLHCCCSFCPKKTSKEKKEKDKRSIRGKIMARFVLGFALASIASAFTKLNLVYNFYSYPLFLLIDYSLSFLFDFFLII